MSDGLVIEAQVASQREWRGAELIRPHLQALGRAALYVALPLVLIALWQAAFELGLIRHILLPPPTKVALAFWQLASTGDLFRHLGISLLRVLEGFAIAGGIGLVLGVGIGLWRRLDRLTDLTIQLLKPIPPIAWIPLAILWFGIGEAGKIYIIFLGAFFPILINTMRRHPPNRPPLCGTGAHPGSVAGALHRPSGAAGRAARHHDRPARG